MNCLGSQTPYGNLPDDHSSSSPSPHASGSTNDLTPSGTSTSQSVGAIPPNSGSGAATTERTPPASSHKSAAREKSAQRVRSRRSNIDGPFGHHLHAQTRHVKETVECPTCRGQGKVPKEKEGHLVALIPADDERLKPSKTKRYVAIAVVISLLLAFLTIFFIYPRSFNLQTNIKEPDLYPIDLYINTSQQVVRFHIQNWWFLQNPNYYPIHLTNLNVQAYMNKQVSESNNASVVTIPMRSKLKIYATLQITFEDDSSYLVKFCNDDRSWVHTIFMRFQATAVVNIMGYNFTSIAETYQAVSCGRDKTTTVSPPTTTTTTSSISTTTATATTTKTSSSAVMALIGNPPINEKKTVNFLNFIPL